MQRARSHLQKTQRMSDILNSADTLFLESKTMSSVDAISKHCQLAKGTLYVYFTSREEIYLTLLGNKFNQLLAHIDKEIHNSEIITANVIGQIISQCTLSTNNFLDLSGVSLRLLQSQSSQQSVTEFQNSLQSSFSTTSDLLFHHCYRPVDIRSALIECFSLILGYWQLTPTQGENAKEDFQLELQSALCRYWKDYFN